jgi:hypothetical protein
MFLGLSSLHRTMLARPETLGEIGALALEAVNDGPLARRVAATRSVVIDSLKSKSRLASKDLRR